MSKKDQEPEQPNVPDERSGAELEKLQNEIEKAGGRPEVSDAVGAAKLAGTSLWRVLTSFTKGSAETAADLAKDIQSGAPISEVIDHQVEQLRSSALQALGLDDGDSTRLLSRGMRRGGVSDDDLRAIGNSLLQISWNSANQPRSQHPAFALMLQSITPDEARILRFLAVAGPQPSLDVRSKTPFGVGSERLGGGFNLVADMSGCAYPDRDQHYLANLNRLGLVRFSQEPVEDFRRYSFIEAQPKVDEAMAKASKAKTVYRSIYLSLFGHQFCEVCFDLEGYDAGGWVTDDRGDKIIGKGRRGPKKKAHH